jgi:four helix bundle protein
MTFAFEDLEVHQRALRFSVSVINVVDQMATPRKHYRLIEQLEASSTSVAMNISEGKGRYSKKEFERFLYIARGSLYETVTVLQVFRLLTWLDENDYDRLYDEAEQINKMLSGLIKSIR